MKRLTYRPKKSCERRPTRAWKTHRRRWRLVGSHGMLQCERAGARAFILANKTDRQPTPADKSLWVPGVGSGIRRGRGMLYTIVMMVCMTAVPQTCEQREEMADGLAMNPGVAFMQAQPLVAHWLETHPAISCSAGACCRAGEADGVFEAGFFCACRSSKNRCAFWAICVISSQQAFLRQSWTADKAAARLSSAHRRRKSAIAHAH